MIDIGSLCKQLAPIGMQIQPDQRWILMHLIINKDPELIRRVGIHEDISALLKNKPESNMDASLFEIVQVFSSFHILTLDSALKLFYQLDFNSGNPALKEAFEVYKALGELENLADDLNIIGPKLPSPPEHLAAYDVEASHPASWQKTELKFHSTSCRVSTSSQISRSGNRTSSTRPRCRPTSATAKTTKRLIRWSGQARSKNFKIASAST